MNIDEATDAVVKVYYANPLGWNLLAGAALVAAMFKKELTRTKWEWWNTIPRRRGKMLRRERRNYVRLQTIDALVNYVEERVYNGEFTRAEASELYRDARKYWPVKDLFPSPELLKKNIEYRLKNQVNKDIPLPDRKEKAPKHMFQKPVKA